jgi:hypothetical protein
VISALVNRRSKKRKKRDRELITIPITIPKETLCEILKLFASTLDEKMPSQLRDNIQAIRSQIEPTAPQLSSREKARANSDQAIALGTRLKAEQAEKARQAALIKPRPKLNKAVLELPPEPTRHP